MLLQPRIQLAEAVDLAKHGPAGLASVELPCKMDLQKNILQEGQRSKNGPRKLLTEVLDCTGRNVLF